MKNLARLALQSCDPVPPCYSSGVQPFFPGYSFVCAALAFALLAGTSRAETAQLTQGDVTKIIAQAVEEARRIDPNAIIAVTDREGFLLGLWDVRGNLPTPLPNFDVGSFAVVKLYSLVAGAITRASTAAFLSSNQEAFTSRTAGYIIQQHFPVGVRNTGTGPLVGVGFSSLFYSDVNRVKLIPPGFDGADPIDARKSPGARAPAFPLTSLNDSPGGVPLYKDGQLVGGIGVTGDGSPTDLTPAGAIFFNQTQRDATTGFKMGEDQDEFVALAGQTGFRPADEIVATNVLINGIRIPYVFPRLEDIRDAGDAGPLGEHGHAIDVPAGKGPDTPIFGPGFVVGPGGALIPVTIQIGTTPGAAVFASGSPQASPAEYPYEHKNLGGFDGKIRFPFRDDPHLSDPARSKIQGARRLDAGEVEGIIRHAAERAFITRAGIRLPVGTSAKVFISVVNNPFKAGEPPAILGVFGTGEPTIFSWDVSVQKARTAVFFSNRQLAESSRTVGFLAQRFFPPGLDGRPHGPYFGFQEAVTLRQKPGTPPHALGFPGNPNLPNGMTIFPGGFPLYRNGQLIGAIGISGDGVDQDDIIATSGTVDFLPNPNIRADNYIYRGARLPYVKFPRDPVR